jgi:hypothetical protein
VGNCFLRIWRSSENFSADAENENKSVAKFPATNPQVLPLAYPLEISQKTFPRAGKSAGKNIFLQENQQMNIFSNNFFFDKK